MIKKMKIGLSILMLFIGAFLIFKYRPIVFEVSISAKHYNLPNEFKDENFYKCVVDKYNSDNDTNIAYTTNLTDEQIQSILFLACEGKEIINTSGLEKMPNLYYLSLNNNNIESLDVSNESKLEHLYLNDNKITNLNLSNNVKLTNLKIDNTNLTALDLHNNTELKYLDAANNQFNNLNLSSNTKLSHLKLSYNQITSLDLHNNTELTYIDIPNNQINSLDLSYNNKLRDVNVAGNPINNLNIKGLSELIHLNIASTQVKSLFLSDSTKLNSIYAYISELETLDLSKNTELSSITIVGNQLTSLDLSKNTKLKSVDVRSNQLKNIDISNCTELVTLYVNNNQLENINLSDNTKLSDLRLTSNQLESVDLSNNTLLSTLIVTNNRLSSLDLSKNTKLNYLNTNENNLNSLDLSNNTELTYLEIVNNILTDLNISKNIHLKYLFVENNRLKTLDLSNNTELTYARFYANSYEFSDIAFVNTPYLVENRVVKFPANIASTLLSVTNTYGDSLSVNVGDSTIIAHKSGEYNNILGFKSGLQGEPNTFDTILYLKVIDITSEKYVVDSENEYIYIGADDDASTIIGNLNVPQEVELDIDLTNNKITVLYDSKVLKEFTIVKVSSTTYDLSKQYIFIGSNSFDISKITVTNGDKEVVSNKLQIKKNNTVVGTFDIVKLSSNFYDLSKDYIYLGTVDFDISKISLVNAQQYIDNDLYQVKYGADLLKAFDLLKIKINNYRLINDTVMIPTDSSYSAFTGNITTTGVSYKVFNGNTEISSGVIENGMKLKIYKDETLLDEYTISTEYLNFDESLNVNEEGKYIYKIVEGTKVSDLLSKVDTSANVKVKNNKGTLLTNTDFVGTGSKIIMEFSGRTEEYVIIVEGDLTGDGIINIADVIKLADHTVTRDVLTDIEQKAGEVTGDTTLNIADVIKLADYTVDKSIILVG